MSSRQIILWCVLSASRAFAETPATPQAPTGYSDAARMAATFAGALLGFAVPIVPMAAFGTSDCQVIGCTDGPKTAVLAATPLLGLTGALISHKVLDGRGGFGAALLGVSAGAASTMLTELAWVFALRGEPTGPQLWQIAATQVLLSAALLTLALEVRHRVLTELPSLEVPSRRFGFETLTFTGGVMLSGLPFVFVASRGSLAAGLVVGGLLVAGSAVASWLVHRALGGKGTVFHALLGTLAAVALATLFSFVGDATIRRASPLLTGPGPSVLWPEIAAISALGVSLSFAPSFALEFGHHLAMQRELANRWEAHQESDARTPRTSRPTLTMPRFVAVCR
jgi:hypothetical protein